MKEATRLSRNTADGDDAEATKTDMQNAAGARTLWNPNFTLVAEAECCTVQNYPTPSTFGSDSSWPWQPLAEICIHSADRRRDYCGRCIHDAQNRISAVGGGAYAISELEIGHGHHVIFAVLRHLPEFPIFSEDGSDEEAEKQQLQRESFKTYCRWEMGLVLRALEANRPDLLHELFLACDPNLFWSIVIHFGSVPRMLDMLRRRDDLTLWKDSAWPVGRLYVIHGLESDAGRPLNGLLGEVRKQNDAGRLCICLKNGDPQAKWKAMKPENVRPATVKEIDQREMVPQWVRKHFPVGPNKQVGGKCGSASCLHIIFEDTSTFKKCSACGRVRYCSVECQKLDWKNHKKYCVRS